MLKETNSVKFIKQQKGRVKLLTKSDYVKSLIRQNYSEPNKAAEFDKRQSKLNSPISPLMAFKTGLTLEIVKLLKNDLYFKGTILLPKELRLEVKPLKFNKNNPILPPGNRDIQYYSYQEDCIRKALCFGRGVVNSSTGSGKSLIIYGLIKNILWYINKNFKCLIVVPNPHLVSQFYDNFIEYGSFNNTGDNVELNVGQFASFSDDIIDNPNPDDYNIVIANRDMLLNHYETKMIFKPDVVIVDEAHCLKKGKSITRLISKIETPIKFGFTGTLKDLDDKDSEWNIKGITGPEIFTKFPYELQKDEYIAPIHIAACKFIHNISQPQPNREEFKTEDDFLKALYPEEYKYVESCDKVNKFICKFIYKLNGNTIVLFDHLAHLDYMYEYINRILNKNGEKYCYRINGGTPLKERKEACQCMEEKSGVIIMAVAKCFGTGINIKNINNLVIANGYSKACTKLAQSIGRGLRVSKDKKYLCFYDLYHSFRYSSRHFSKRLKIYKQYYNKTVTDIRYNTIDVNRIKSQE